MATQSKEAPGDLDVVRSFVNTLDVEAGTDELGTPRGLSAWLEGRPLAGQSGRVAHVSEDDARRARAFREALRELLLANNDAHTPDRQAALVLDDVAERAALRLRVSPDGKARLEAEAPGVDGVLGRLLVVVYRAMEEGTWPRLKACRDDTCRWAFYDHSRNRSGHWCSMSACGNRNKVQAYRLRQADEQS